MKRVLTTLVLGVSIAACGGSDSTPAPAPTPTPTPQVTRIIGLSGNMAFGSMQVGSNFEAVLRINNTGTGTLTVSGLTGPSGYSADWTSGTVTPGGSQGVTVRFSPTEERSYNGTLTVNADHTSGTNTISVSGTGTRPPGPRTQFGAGQYLVGTDIVAARYFDDPLSGCYWERQSGLGGSLGEILANDFIGFNAGQWIVDISPTDRAFQTDADCGTWFQTPRRGLQADITPGVWLVGSQVNPGTYRADVNSGCYWERRRAFAGTLSDIIANNFISSAGQQLVEVRAGDVGFHSDGDCNTWTAVPAALVPSRHEAPQSAADISANREMQRRKNRVRGGR